MSDDKTKIVTLSCLPQSKHLLELYNDVGDVGMISRASKPCFTVTDNPFNGEWASGEVTEIHSSEWGE